MSSLTHSDELIVGQQYRIILGPCEGEIGSCKAIHTSGFGYVWGEIELSAETLRVRWNLLAAHPEPPKPEINTKINVWMCPTCGSQGLFAGFCDADPRNHSTRLVHRSCVTVEQIERARDEYVDKSPETSGTVDVFLKKVFDTPLLRSEVV